MEKCGVRSSVAAVVLLFTLGLQAQESGAKPAAPPAPVDDSEVRPPVTKADVEIVKRAEAILDTPAKWNRADDRNCPAGAKTFSFYCALEKATDDVSGKFEHRGAAMQEARFVIDDLLPNNNYAHRLMDYNNDPHRTFAEIQNALHLLEERIAKRLAAQQSASAGTGAAAAPAPLPAVAGAAQRTVTATDLEVIRRARALLDTPTHWSRTETDHCPADAPSFSLYCALQIAGREAKADPEGNAAIHEARVLISASPNHAKYSARLVDYNADPDTTFSDVQKLLRTAEEHLMQQLATQGGGKE